MTNCYKGELPVPQIMVFLKPIWACDFHHQAMDRGHQGKNFKEHSSQNNYDTSKA